MFFDANMIAIIIVRKNNLLSAIAAFSYVPSAGFLLPFRNLCLPSILHDGLCTSSHRPAPGCNYRHEKVYITVCQGHSLECLARPLPRPVSALPFTVIGLHSDRRPDQRLKSRCLFQADQLVLHIREKSRKTDPDRILSGSIYSCGFGCTDRRKYVPHRQTTEIESLGTLPRELTQISHSDASGHNLTSPGAARYFDYESAVALRNLAAA